MHIWHWVLRSATRGVHNVSRPYTELDVGYASVRAFLVCLHMLLVLVLLLLLAHHFSLAVVAALESREWGDSDGVGACPTTPKGSMS
jgi:hypothetical protein